MRRKPKSNALGQTLLSSHSQYLKLKHKKQHETMSSNNSIAQDVPEEFLCPITQELMINPLMSRTGINYEKSAIMEWISNHNNTCPMTRQPLRACDLIHNRNLQSKICIWCAANGMEEACKEMPFNPNCRCHNINRTDYVNELSCCTILYP